MSDKEREDLPETVFSPSEPAAQGEAEVPREIGRYRLVRRLGEGGMGEVWLAEQSIPVRRQVALKVIKPGMDSREVIARFEAERQALALMDHPAVAKVLDAGTTPLGRPYFVMEYIGGVPITEFCDRHRLDNRQRLELFCEVCEGVQHAHQKAIIHRDLKPSNILVIERGGRFYPKIIDFGVAKATAWQLTEKTMFTQMGVMVGTPAYMSPEQVGLGGEDVDTRTDVYALGVVLYELIAGALPFDPKDLTSGGFEAIRRKIREEEPPRPSTRASDLGDRTQTSARARGVDPGALPRQLRGDLDWITLKALEKERARRYPSPMDLAADIQRYLRNEPVLAMPPRVGYRVRKFIRRHRVAVTTAAVLLLALLIGVAGTTVGLLRARQAEAIAWRESETAARVSAFMSGMLESVEPVRMGRSLREDLAERTARAGSLENVNMVDVAQGLIDREILARAEAMVDSTLTDDPAIASRLYVTIGRSYLRGLLLYDEAVATLRKAHARACEGFGADGLETMNSAQELGMALSRVGGRENWEEAKQIFGDCLAVQERERGPGHLEALNVRMMLADQYRYLGEHETAAPMLREVVVGLRRLDQPDNPILYYAVNDLALALQASKEDRPEAEELFREAIAGLDRILGPDHFETLNVRVNLARLIYAEGRNEEAVVYLRGLLEDARRSLGSETDLTDQAVGLMAASLRRLDRTDEAMVFYEEGIRTARLLGHLPRVATRTINLAVVQMGAGADPAATERMLVALESELRHAQDSRVKSSHRITLYNLACLASRRSDRTAGLDWLEQAVAAGFDNPEQMAGDTDLEALRGPRFDALLEQVQAAAARSSGSS
jgi:serine/threonine protein kinase/tetratricopeptide (TPR) repeat protein